MKKLPVVMYVLFTCFTIFSCTTTTLLNATFEHDMPGSHPARDLAGAPTGDALQYNSGLEPQLIVRDGTLTPGTTAGRALYFTNATPGSTSRHEMWASFKGTSTNLANTIWIFYTAKNTDAISPLLINVSDGTATPVAKMRIEPNGNMYLARDMSDEFTDFVGNIGTVTHTVVFTLNVTNLLYSVTVFKNQGGTLVARDRQMLTRNALEFVNPANPTLSFSYQDAPRSLNQKYIIEEIQITKRIPDMMR